MRRSFIGIAGCTALIVLFGLSAPVYAWDDSWVPPYCERDNSFRLFNVDVRTDTPDANAVSGVTVEGDVCGTYLRPAETYEEAGSGTQNVHFRMRTARGVEYNSTAEMANERYVGKLDVGVSFWWFEPGSPWMIWWYDLPLFVDHGDDTDCPPRAKACYKGVMDPSWNDYAWNFLDLYNWVWVTEKKGRHTLHVGEIRSNYEEDGYSMSDVPFGFNHINNISICGRAGDVNGDECGDSDQPFVRKNGDAALPGCPRRAGKYRLKVRNRDGLTTDPVTACVDWSGGTR